MIVPPREHRNAAEYPERGAVGWNNQTFEN